MSCEAQCVLSLTTKKQPTAQVEAWSSQLVHTTETLGPRGDRGRRSAAVSQTAVTDRILNKEQRAAGNALLGQLGGPLPGLRLPGPAASPGGHPGCQSRVTTRCPLRVTGSLIPVRFLPLLCRFKNGAELRLRNREHVQLGEAPVSPAA